MRRGVATHPPTLTSLLFPAGRSHWPKSHKDWCKAPNPPGSIYLCPAHGEQEQEAAAAAVS